MSQYLLVNFDRREYLRPEQFGELSELKSALSSQDGMVTALIVLLSDGNGRGGGDLPSSDPLIGTWSGGRIALIDELVTDAQFSAPGMEAVPLQHQMLAGGTDVSAQVIKVIAEAVKDYTILALLNPQLTLPLTAQRALGEIALKLIVTASARKKPIGSQAEFFALLGVSCPWTDYTAQKRLHTGLNQTAANFGSICRYEVQTVKTVKHTVTEAVPYSNATTRVSKVRELTAQVRELSSDKLMEVSVTFGPKGSTAEQVFAQLFPDVQFEKAPSLADSVTSPEVAKLLSMISKLEA